MENGAQRKRKVPLIHRVQNNIRLAEKNAYDPVLISIGPYHHGTPSLAAAEKDKWASLDYILKLNQERNLQDYLHVLSSLTDRARNTYSEEIEMDEDKFLQMLLLDGCFIIVSLYGTAGLFNNLDRKERGTLIDKAVTGSSKNKAEVSEVELTDFNAEESIQRGKSVHTSEDRCGDKGPWYNSFVAHDLLLLENQIPFFIVKGIYELLVSDDSTSRLLTDNIGDNIQITKGRGASTLCKNTKRLFDHKSPHSLLDINFVHGVVEIPFLMIDDKTSFLFRNIVAFEQSCPQFGNYFTAYVCFVSQLLSLPKDVTILAKRGIIVHQMRSDDEVSVLFTKLGKNVDFDVNGKYYLRHLCHVMEEHYQSRLNRWMAWLWQNHFSNPWLSLAVIAGAVVLLCTILQSLFALLAHVKPADPQ
ncbi:uncharacterized protein LOC127775651 [Oryza glaberrima]|uniref:uncharacterized protein LOC127775651 n=1 Tax=Oryza glaberrima TaxID=4538 RepID=UPI00224C00F4|nr:uncharacterized protein LOC127775651 [Oryza glaberrima]